jgi:hypothetical protein
MDFNVKIKLPSGKTVRVPELKNRDYFTILKFCENEDMEGLSNFFDFFQFNKILGTDIIDKFYLLLLVRMMYVDPELILMDKNKVNINFSIQNIIDNIDQFDGDYNRIYRKDRLLLELGLPDSLYFNSLNDIFLSIIKRMEVSDKAINFDSLTEVEREEVLSYVPSSVFTILKDHIDIISANLSDFVIIETNEEFGIEGINLDVVSNGIISFLLSIFSTGLTNFFEMMYIFTSKLGFTAEDFYNLTPLDSKVILNIYRKELAEKEEELKNQEGV